MSCALFLTSFTTAVAVLPTAFAPATTPTTPAVNPAVTTTLLPNIPAVIKLPTLNTNPLQPAPMYQNGQQLMTSAAPKMSKFSPTSSAAIISATTAKAIKAPQATNAQNRSIGAMTSAAPKMAARQGFDGTWEG